MECFPPESLEPGLQRKHRPIKNYLHILLSACNRMYTSVTLCVYLRTFSWSMCELFSVELQSNKLSWTWREHSDSRPATHTHTNKHTHTHSQSYTWGESERSSASIHRYVLSFFIGLVWDQFIWHNQAVRDEDLDRSYHQSPHISLLTKSSVWLFSITSKWESVTGFRTEYNQPDCVKLCH